MIKLKRKGLVKILLAVVLMVGCFAGVGSNEAQAAQRELKVAVGFYGGPYHELHTFTYEEMCAMADDQIYIYSGTNEGGKMCLSYVWGVPLATVVSEAGIDLGSVTYFHFLTEDNISEERATRSVSSLLGTTRYYYPNMTKLIDIYSPGNDQYIDYSDTVTIQEAEVGAQRVPAILAIRSTEFTGVAAVEAAKNGYVIPDLSNIPDDFHYRLLYGQTGLSSPEKSSNVQESGKWIERMDVQLNGTPNISMEKELISGEEGKVGSKYSVKLDVSLPSSYSYIPEEIRQQLIAQILESVTPSDYDQSVINVTQGADGSYEMEIVGEGTAELSFSYTRQDYKGETTSSSQVATITGSATGASGGATDGDLGETDSTGNGDDETSQTDGEGDVNLGLVDDVKTNTDKVTPNASAPTVSKKHWMSVDDIAGSGAEEGVENKPIVVEEAATKGAIAAGTAICLGIGFVSTLVTYYRRR